MPVLIDGDNLLHAARGLLPDGERMNRAALCSLLADWDVHGSREVTVFFDGVRPDDRGEGPVGAGALSIRYSDRRTADALIVEAIASSSAPRRLLVVSGDREVKAAARRRRARRIDSDRFMADVVKALRRSDDPRRSEPPEKRDGLPPGQTDEWMDLFGIDSEPDEEEEFGLLD